MNRTMRLSRGLILSLALGLPIVLHAESPNDHPKVQNVDQLKFAPTPGLPTCAENAVMSGDPATGGSVLLGRLKSGCVIPWHWHTPNEHLMLASGEAEIDTRNGKPQPLQAGGFALMPSRHVHQFRCVSECLLYVYSDAAFDTHYVDEKGNEISPADALKAVGEETIEATAAR